MNDPEIIKYRINGDEVELQLFCSTKSQRAELRDNALLIAHKIKVSIADIYRIIGIDKNVNESDYRPIILKFIDAQDGVLIFKKHNDDKMEIHVNIDNDGKYEDNETIVP